MTKYYKKIAVVNALRAICKLLQWLIYEYYLLSYSYNPALYFINIVIDINYFRIDLFFSVLINYKITIIVSHFPRNRFQNNIKDTIVIFDQHFKIIFNILIIYVLFIILRLKR